MGLGLLALRLTFGGRACPPLWTIISEMMTDLANDVLNCLDWSPSEIHSPMQDEVPPPNPLPDKIPLAPALPTAVRCYPSLLGMIDSFIDDFITVCPDIGGNMARAAAVVPLVLHIFGRPVHPDHPTNRANLTALNKLLAEGALEEVKLILGWQIDTRRMLISLPEDKHDMWVADLQKVMKDGRIRKEDVDTLVGRLNHSAHIIPTLRHFLHRIRALQCTDVPPKTWLKLDKNLLDDLPLYTTFLQRARDGISLNNVTLRTPTHLLWADSCPEGLGGYSVSGHAWRLQLEEHLLDRVSNNVLEFMAQVITAWIEIRAGRVPPLSCLLALSDSSSACGWLHKSNFWKVFQVVHAAVARKLAELVTEANSPLFSQHFRGELNNLSDCFSREHHLCDDDLTQKLVDEFSSQIPRNFKICQLPSEIKSWVSQTLLLLPKSKTLEWNRLSRKKTELGDDGISSSKTSKPTSTSTSPASTTTPTPNSSSSPASPPTSDEDPFLDELRTKYQAAIVGKPLGAYQRSFGVTIGSSPPTTIKGSSTQPSKTRSKDTATRTHHQDTKKRSHSSSSD